MIKGIRTSDTMLVIAALLTVTIILAGGMANLGTSLSAQGQVQGMKFTAQLSGKDEVPPVDTTATGTVTIPIEPRRKRVNIRSYN